MSLKPSVGPFKLARSASRSCRARALPFRTTQRIPRTPRVQLLLLFFARVLEGGVDGVLGGRCGEGDQGPLCQGAMGVSQNRIRDVSIHAMEEQAPIKTASPVLKKKPNLEASKDRAAVPKP